MPPDGDGCRDHLAPERLPLTVARLRLRLAPAEPAPRVDHLRAAIASLRPELDFLHQHGHEGVIYRYPRVLYRIQEGVPTVIAVAEGVELLSQLTLVGQDFRLGATIRSVQEATLNVQRYDLGPTRSPRRYRFATPWLALNQENHARFGRMREGEQIQFLDAQVANNCLSLAKSLGLRIATRIKARAHVWPVPVEFKDIEMLGFLGDIEVNFNLPEGLGIGKSVSKGFGAVTAEPIPCN